MRMTRLRFCFSFIALAVAAASAADSPKLPAGAREISLDETEKLVVQEKTVPVIDVRTAQEYSEQGHLPRAQLVDFFREDFEDAIKSLKFDASKPVVVYCAIGGRAKRVAERLAKMGFKEILLPQGSFNAWKKAGKPVEGARK